MFARIGAALHAYWEAGVMRLIALAAIVGAGLLVAADLMRTPMAHYPASVMASEAATGWGAETATTPARTAPAAGASGRSIASAEANADRRGDLHDVTVFARTGVELEGRHLTVVTGLVYASASDPTAVPVRSFCYLEAAGSSPESQVTVRLAAKTGDEPVRPADLQQSDAAAVTLPLASLRSATASCRFL